MGCKMLGRSIAAVLTSIISVAILLGAGVGVLIYMSDSPLPDQWNPTKPLVITDPVNMMTNWKLTRALADGNLCKTALATAAEFNEQPDQIDSAQCGIQDHVSLQKIGSARIRPVNTRCQTALRWAMWTTHDLQPKAAELFNQKIREIRHFSSYNCRKIRSSSGSDGRMSTHATAEAIDVAGFILQDGTRIDLKADWDGTSLKSQFLRYANTTACNWFRVTLGPNYNALHADHFHLQHTGWGLCR
ncbi:MAG: hypothetical protein ACI9PY_003181 [Ascidiaceihabitans sp.]|jgi:hypothetical protein